jgi:hypothetical protein
LKKGIGYSPPWSLVKLNLSGPCQMFHNDWQKCSTRTLNPNHWVGPHSPPWLQGFILEGIIWLPSWPEGVGSCHCHSMSGTLIVGNGRGIPRGVPLMISSHQTGARSKTHKLQGLPPCPKQTGQTGWENLLSGVSGHICPSKSPMTSLIFFIKKKDGSLHLVQDYWALNAFTIKNWYPLPLILELVNQLWGAKYFTKLNAQWGYNNVWMKEGNKWKAAFHTNWGLFKPLVMFFGLTNSFFCLNYCMLQYNNIVQHNPVNWSISAWPFFTFIWPSCKVCSNLIYWLQSVNCWSNLSSQTGPLSFTAILSEKGSAADPFSSVLDDVLQLHHFFRTHLSFWMYL